MFLSTFILSKVFSSFHFYSFRFSFSIACVLFGFKVLKSNGACICILSQLYRKMLQLYNSYARKFSFFYGFIKQQRVLVLGVCKKCIALYIFIQTTLFTDAMHLTQNCRHIFIFVQKVYMQKHACLSYSPNESFT